jgi:hypothetical protein
MEKPSPHLLRALRQAQLYGPLIARDDGLSIRAATTPFAGCTTATPGQVGMAHDQ